MFESAESSYYTRARIELSKPISCSSNFVAATQDTGALFITVLILVPCAQPLLHSLPLQTVTQLTNGNHKPLLAAPCYLPAKYLGKKEPLQHRSSLTLVQAGLFRGIDPLLGFIYFYKYLRNIIGPSPSGEQGTLRED